MAKKLDYEIRNVDALKNAFPELVSEEIVHRVVKVKGEVVSDETTTRSFVARDDKEKLYRLVKLNHEMGRTTAGITVKTAEDAEAAKAEAAQKAE